MRFLDWDFTDDFGSASHVSDERVIRFTRSERALIETLATHRDRIYSRSQLLDAVSGWDSEVADRSIDYLINRVRRKLGDSARKPRYIRTRYGEGYGWVAPPVPEEADTAGAFIVVGPAFGLPPQDEAGAAYGNRFARALANAMDRYTADAERVCLDMVCPAPAAFRGRHPVFAVELSFLEADAAHFDCALTLRRFPTRVIVAVSRLHLDATVMERQAARTARDLVDTIWQAMNYSAGQLPGPEDEPLPVRLHSSTERIARDRNSWEEAEARVRDRLRTAPDDAELKVKLATTIHSRYVMAGYALMHDPGRRAEDEAEIEQLVMTALPHVQTNDIFTLMCAKLLYFVNAAHRVLAVDLSETIFQRTTALASAFATVGQIRMWQGRIDDALVLYDKGLAMAEHATHFDLYLRVLKCDALTADGRVEAARTAASALYRIKPATREELGCFYEAESDDEALAPIVARQIARLDLASAIAIVRYRHYIAARLFRHERHRRNVMQRPASLLEARFGRDCLPTDLHHDIPPRILRHA